MTSLLRRWAEKDGRGYPDWAMRYVPIARLIGPHIKPGARVLEIGANANGLARFLPPETRVLGVNLDPQELRDACAAQSVIPFLGDATSLPVATAQADVCVCVDTLEHIPSSLRRQVVHELLRVTKPSGLCVIAFPSGEAAAAVEARVREEYRRLTGGDLRWIAEHQELGLPDADEALAWAREASGDGREVRMEWNSPLWLWRWVWRVLMCNWPGRGNAATQALLRAITPLLCGWRAGSGYRAIIRVAPSRKPPVA